MHDQVVAELAREGPGSPRLEALRACGARAADALAAADWDALGRIMIENTAAQTALHDSVVSPDARRVIALAQDCGALGWKVNGAGGDGGSLTVLSRLPADEELADALDRTPGVSVIPIRLSPHGVSSRES
jgi:D-glycero-alpha-D-manno-heptose-7-phosphate kinase